MLCERRGAHGFIHGPVVVDPPPGAEPIEVAAQLVSPLVDSARALPLDSLFARPQGLDRVWVRLGFVPDARGLPAGRPARAARDGPSRLAPSRDLRGSRPGPRGRGPAARAAVIVALAGGTGAAKLLRGLVRVTEPGRLFIVGNTGDDLDWWGLRVSPDLDSVAYALAGLLDATRGWGVRDDTFHCLEAMDRLGRETWFRLGDRDLATHLHRTLLLRAGASLTAATRAITDALGVTARLVPMSDDPVRTELRTGERLAQPGGVLRPRAVRARRPGRRVPGRRERPAGARRPRGDRRGGGGRRLLLESRDLDRTDPRGARRSSTPWSARRRPSWP